jgi:hypothetical protein
MQSRAKEVLCSSYLTLLISFLYNSTGGQTLVRDFAMRWIWCDSPTCKWHQSQEFLSATANRSHLSLMLSFLCVECALSNRTTASKMPPFSLSLFWQFLYWRWRRAVGFCIGLWWRLHCRYSVCQVLFLYFCSAVLCDLEIWSIRSLLLDFKSS